MFDELVTKLANINPICEHYSHCTPYKGRQCVTQSLIETDPVEKHGGGRRDTHGTDTQITLTNLTT